MHYFDKQLSAEDMLGLGETLLEMKKNLNKQNRPTKNHQ